MPILPSRHNFNRNKNSRDDFRATCLDFGSLMKTNPPPNALRNLARKTSNFFDEVSAILSRGRTSQPTVPYHGAQAKLKRYRKFRVPKLSRI
jgi:hypothetical protein